MTIRFRRSPLQCCIAAGLVALLALAGISCAAPPEWLAPAPMVPALSLQGFTGILNTPSARVQEEGNFQVLYGSQIDERWRGTAGWQDNYLFSVGLFSFAEIGGRLTNTSVPPGVRDLSASFKFSSAPLTRGMPLFPVIAAGVQDVGGGSNHLQARYIVVSEDLWRLRLSAGYGFGPDRMKGGFAGAEFKAHDWAWLLGEYDTREFNAGVRLITPEIWRTPLRLTTTLKTSLDHKPGNFDIAAGITFPLDFRKNVQGSTPEKPVQGSTPVEPVQGSKFNVQSATSNLEPRTSNLESRTSNLEPRTLNLEPRTLNLEPRTSHLESLRLRLLKAGFIDVRVGSRDERELVVEYENVVFNHNELDALGVVIGMAAEAAPEGYETVRIVSKRRGIPMVALGAPLSVVRPFLKGGGVRDLRNALKVDYGSDDRGVVFAAADSGWKVPPVSLLLAPGLTTFVGTDVGAFDYLLSLKPELSVTTWKGGVLYARWDIPLAWSENLDDGKLFSSSRANSRMERLMLFQAFKPLPDVMLNLGAGMILHDIYGTLNEAIWSPGNGAHRFRVLQAWSENGGTRRRSESYLGSYRYFFNPLDLSLEATAGRFWAQDRGYMAEMKRFFGDTAVSLFYKNSTTYQEGKHWQAAGIQFAFPLTPRKDLKVGPLVVRGSDEWGYAQETTLAIGGQKSNDVLMTPLAINPQPPTALYRAYYNRDRLSSAYIKAHLERLREAWLIYKD